MDDKAGGIRIGVGAVIFRGEDVLLVRRGKPPFLGAWSIPGGGLRFGETLEAATLREVREETGIEAALRGFLGVFELLPDADGEAASTRHVVLVDYWGEWREGAPVAGDDAAEAGFFPLEEALRRPGWETTRRAIARAAELRRASCA